jgi:NADPH2:quinone reductase
MSHAITAPGYGEPEILEYSEISIAKPGEGQVTIRVKAAGVNPSDLKTLRGEFGRSATMPLRLGSELAGVVTAVGTNAIGISGPVSVGDEVIGFRVPGAFADTVTAKAAALVPKPATLGWEEAAGLMLVGTTATHLLEATAVSAGDRVIVHGASGGVGVVLVQLALLRGAVVVGTAGASSLERVRALGARAVEYGPGLADRIRAVFPDGVDVALDTVGTDEAVDVSLELVTDRARIASIAAFGYGAERGITLLGGGAGADAGTQVRDAARATLAELAGSGRIKVTIARTFALRDAAAALDYVARGHSGGKVVLLP